MTRKELERLIDPDPTAAVLGMRLLEVLAKLRDLQADLREIKADVRVIQARLDELGKGDR
jgi:hypothetical protein